MAELASIRVLVSAARTVAAPKPAARGEVPQPDEIVENAGLVTVHFGKNKGVPLEQLGEKSLEWYAQDQEPRLRQDGTPFPPRREDVELKNAARTYLHQRRGTLAGAPKAAALTTNTPESDMPF